MSQDEEVDYLRLSIRGQDGSLLHYKVKRDKPMETVLKNYCETKRLVYESMHFLNDGLRVLGKQKPKRRYFEDGVEILAVTQVSGGGGAASLSFC